MRNSLGLVLAGAVLLSTAAKAEIRVNEARYEAGFVTVRGETTRPFRWVTLDRRFRRRSDRLGRFTFRARHLPFLCKAKLRSGRDEHSAAVANCWADDGVDPSNPRLRH